MERRQFLRLAGSVGAGICVIPPSLYFLAPGVNEYAIKLIKKEFHYLKLAPGSVEKYVEDYFNIRKNDMVSTLKWKATYYLDLDYDHSERSRDLLRYFLLSTDFFINKTDERKTVNYLGFYSPYTSPVPNPYSFVIYPPSGIREP
ncbi:hypothetical protein [Pedobacter hartonius]|uniref:Uncharacterized protein n=1 Tax=Pedobacter hartonius TaxID=425514 RepID=A0A1H4GK74_9SPHI|nr:hypothetical protein [Pedobacter hartonius]SEB09062.1 hypothetical protein SAMN05443550_11073 [Pedobacter hartonius]